MNKQGVLLMFLFFASTKSFPINDSNNYQLNHRIKRIVSASIPNIIEITNNNNSNNELPEWPLNENNSPTRNDLLIGQCGIRDQRVYTDDILVENSGPSTLNGTLEVTYQTIKQ